MQKAAKVSKYIFYGLLAYMPLHIFISTVVGVNLGVLDLAKATKDLVLMFGFCLIFFVSVNKPWFKKWMSNKTTLLILAYALLTLLVALFKNTDTDAEILGIVFNLRFFLFFLYGTLLTHYFPVKELRQTALKIVLGVGLVVVVFGVIQYLVLPNDALSHLGFERSNGVLPAFFIDDKPDLERVMSTVRDPNSLGSYLIIVTALVTATFYGAKKQLKKWWLGYGALALLCMYFTFSRSAWLGVCVSLAVFAGLAVKNHTIGKKLFNKNTAWLAILALFIIVAGIFMARNTYYVQNVIFHSDQSTTLEDPNQLRIRFWKESINSAVDNPLGHGPGTAGLASIKNDIQGTELNENYYLQIVYEVGFLGLGIFLIILFAVAYDLYKRAGKDQFYVWALLASFAGLMVTNFLVHIWSNEAVAYTWWGLAGLYIATKGLVSSAAAHDKE